MAGPGCGQRRLHLPTRGHDMGAARGEQAAFGPSPRVRHRAGNGVQPLSRGHPARPGNAVQQADRVRMRWLREHGDHIPLLHHAAAVHHHHLVRDFRHHAEIMGDEQDGHADIALQPAHQIENLRLDRHVQRRGRLVGDQQGRAAAQRHRHHDALAHAAGQLVRIFPRPAFRRRNPHHPQHGDGGLPRRAGRQLLVQHDRFGDLVAHGEDRVQRRHRLLEDHADIVPAQPPHVALAGGAQVLGAAILVGEQHLAADDAAVGPVQQPHDGQAGDGFSRA